MKANEIMCLENPEAHLHPRLQLGVAELLIQHAAIGKYMVIETHSDLIIRRVMRAVLAEELKQEAVRLYFTRLDVETDCYLKHGITSSVLEPVAIDARGQIHNWPPGFMDEDVREARRPLDLMYGAPNGQEDEEERIQ